MSRWLILFMFCQKMSPDPIVPESKEECDKREKEYNWLKVCAESRCLNLMTYERATGANKGIVGADERRDDTSSCR